MSARIFETVYDASARLNVPVSELLEGIKKLQVPAVERREQQQFYSMKQMNWVAHRQQKKLFVTNAQKAQIIEMFTCKKDNQITRIAAEIGISYHHVFNVIDKHMMAISNHRIEDGNCNFLTLESSINQK